MKTGSPTDLLYHRRQLTALKRIGHFGTNPGRAARRTHLIAIMVLLMVQVSTVSAATISVANGQVAIAADGQCSLLEAVDNANSTTSGSAHADCVSGNPAGEDTIVLASVTATICLTPPPT